MFWVGKARGKVRELKPAGPKKDVHRVVTPAYWGMAIVRITRILRQVEKKREEVRKSTQKPGRKRRSWGTLERW